MKKNIYRLIFFLLLFVVIDRGIGWILNKGLNHYWGLDQHSTVLLMGHSHLMLATDKLQLEKRIKQKVSKYCREGINAEDRYYAVKQILNSPYSDSLKVVLYGVDQFIFNGKGLSNNSYKLFYPFIDDSSINSYIRKNSSASDYWQHKLICTTRYSDALLNSAIRGYRNDWNNYKNGHLDVEQLKVQISKGDERHICFDSTLKRYFENTLKMLTGRGIKVILINTPIAQPLNDYEPEKYHKIISYFKELATSPLIDYWDFNPRYSTSYDLFFDAIHMNPKGQKVINEQIIDNYNSAINTTL